MAELPSSPNESSDIEKTRSPKRHNPLRVIVVALGTIALVFGIFFLLLNAILSRYEITSDSMGPIIVRGQIVTASRLSYISDAPQRGDIVVVRLPDDPGATYAKRIVGLPGETLTIEDGSIFIDGMLLEEPYLIEPLTSFPLEEKWEIPDEHYFVLGDIRSKSADSRLWGSLSRADIIGRVVMICTPRTYCRPLSRPDY